MVTLIEYITLTKKSDSISMRYHAEMDGSIIKEFLSQLAVLKSNIIIELNVAIQNILQSDRFELNRSIKINQKECWIITPTLYFFDINISKSYLKATNLVASGPGKGFGSDDHTSIFEELCS